MSKIVTTESIGEHTTIVSKYCGGKTIGGSILAPNFVMDRYDHEQKVFEGYNGMCVAYSKVMCLSVHPKIVL